MPALRTIVVGVTALGLIAGLSEAVARAVWPDGAPPQPVSTASHLAPVAIAAPARPVATCWLSDSAPVASGRPRSGGSIALSTDEAVAAVADADADAVVVLNVAAGASSSVRNRFAVGRSPAQVVMASDGRVFVSERASNRVSVYDARDGRRLCTARVATDPVGLALAPDERTVYVTSGLGHALTALDTATFAKRFALDVEREPRGIALSPDGSQAFIAHVAGAPLSLVSRLDGPSPRAELLPGVPIATELNAGVSLGAADRWQPSVAVTPLPSQAYVAALDPQSGRVFVPFMVNRTGRELPPEVRVDRYGGGSVSVSGPEAEKVSFALGAFDPRTRRWDTVVLPRIGAGAGLPQTSRGGIVAQGSTASLVRIPVAAVLRPDGRALMVVSMGTSSLATVPTVAPPVLAHGRGAPRATTPVALSNERTVDAPSGVAITRGGTVLVYSQIAHSVEVRGASGALAAARVALGHEALPPDLARGRRLFYTANNPALSSGGLSCGGCHPDGRDDGLTWFLSHGPRQTPTLAGRVEAPFNWNGTQRTMEGNVAQTIERLGGTGLSIDDVDALAAFVMRGMPAPDRDEADEAVHPAPERVARGHALFAGLAGCATCHDPARNFTDGQSHELGGLGSDETNRLFDTPSLRFVSATAPYFHDGRYATLRQMMLDGSHHMGHVELLRPDDVDAVVAYMQTL